MKRLAGLQYLRGLAACGVVTYHAADRAGRSFVIGEAGVDLFFVLSGFLMWAITDNSRSPFLFLAARAERIIPNYWIVTSVMLLGALAGLFPAVRLTVAHVATSYAFIPSVSPSNGQVWPLLIPGWTLNYEIGFYLLFAVTLFFSRTRQLGALTTTLFGLASCHPWIGTDHALLRFYTDPHILEFLGGVWLAWSWQDKPLAHKRTGPLLIALTLALFALALLFPPDWPKAVRYGLPALTIVAATLAYERRKGGVPDVPLLRLVGDASYSIYLWHTLAMSVTTKVAVWLHLVNVGAIAFHIAAGIGIGLLAYLAIERPLLEIFRQRRNRNPAPTLDSCR